MRPAPLVVAVSLVLAGSAAATAQGPEEALSSSPQGAGQRLDPRPAGARYGQAAGVALLCPGMATTPAVETLKAQYQGEELAAFADQAARILAMWKEALTCTKATGPNECRVSHLASCAAALREIGPGGSAVPGLIEMK